MKKFFNKHQLFCILALVVGIACLATWIFPEATYSNGELAVSNEGSFGFFKTTSVDSRVGIFDLARLSLFGISGVDFIIEILIYLFVVAGFYKFLGSLGAYKNLTTKIANKFNGKENIFVIICSLFLVVFTSVITDSLVVLAIIPFMLSILSKLKVDKVSGLSATFGAALIGILGATYSSGISGLLSSGLGVTLGNKLLIVIITAGIAYLLMIFFISIRMLNKKYNENELLVDPFATVNAEEKKNDKSKSLGLGIVLGISLIITVLAFVAWETAFNITLFNDLYTSITEATVAGTTLFSYILGTSFAAFGSWDLYGLSLLIFVVTLLIKIIYKVPMAHVYEQYIEGCKKIVKTVVVVAAIYVLVEIVAIYPRLAGITDSINAIIGRGNAASLFQTGLVSSLFCADFSIVLHLISSVFTAYTDANISALILQLAYGFAQFVAPTSVLLMIGLSILDIKYTEWFKAMWKFIVSLLALIIIVIVVVTI